MHVEPLIVLAIIFVLGITAQWLAWRLRLPSILLLLIFGILAGPVAGVLDVDTLLGDLLFPFVSLSVGIILFEGGLSLRFHDIRTVGQVIRNLISIGALVTWVLTSAAAYFILGLNVAMAVQFGAVLVVTGPTVIGPLLRHVRPSGRVASILRWEGILIDPVGATLAVLVFDAILIGDLQQAIAPTILAIVLVILVGGVIGLVGGLVLVQLMRRYLIPDYLQNAVTLMSVIAVFALSDTLQHESGLLATTVMGIVLANQRTISIRRIIDFKENIIVILISVLFILLAARLKLSDLQTLGFETVIFLVVMVLIVRPATVFVSTFRSTLKLNERIFLAWMAPRGIVAAAVASIFSLRLVEANHPQAEMLVPLTFAVIITTCALYGLTALPLARRLGLSQANPQGIVFVGAHRWAREIAAAVKQLGYKVVLIDSNRANVTSAHLMGLDAYFGSAISEELEDLKLDGIGRALALTSNDEVNALSAIHFREDFGGKEVYQIAFPPKPYTSSDGADAQVARDLRGRTLFDSSATFAALESWFDRGAVIKATPLTREFDYKAYQAQYNGNAVPLFIHNPSTRVLTVITTESPPQPQSGQTLVSIILPENTNRS